MANVFTDQSHKMLSRIEIGHRSDLWINRIYRASNKNIQNYWINIFNQIAPGNSENVLEKSLRQSVLKWELPGFPNNITKYCAPKVHF